MKPTTQKIFLTDLDGTIRRSTNGVFINNPLEQELFPWVLGHLQKLVNDDWIVLGITDQGGVDAGHKSLRSCILEQLETLRLCTVDGKPLMFAILFSLNNETAFLIEPDGQMRLLTYFLKIGYRKPNEGMLCEAICYQPTGYNFTMSTSVYCGDQNEDKATAKNTGSLFIPADHFHSPNFSIDNLGEQFAVNF